MHVFGKLLNIGFHMNESPQWCKPPTLDGRNRGTRGEMWKKERVSPSVDDKNRRCKGRKNFFPFRPSSLFSQPEVKPPLHLRSIGNRIMKDEYRKVFIF